MPPPHIEDDDEPGFFGRYRVLLILGGLALAGGGYMYANHTPRKSTPKKKMEMISISIPPMPPPPPPPPPPKEEPPPEEKEEEMVAQEEVKAEDQKPDDKPKDKPADEPLGTAISGGNGSGLGLGGGGGGGGMIGGGGGGKGGSKWGWYAGQVQNRLADALRNNAVTKRAGFSNVVKIWTDSTGRIVRVKLTGSTGDSQVDAAIENEVFSGLVLSEPPPDDMPMPINLRLTARKAN